MEPNRNIEQEIKDAKKNKSQHKRDKLDLEAALKEAVGQGLSNKRAINVFMGLQQGRKRAEMNAFFKELEAQLKKNKAETANWLKKYNQVIGGPFRDWQEHRG